MLTALLLQAASLLPPLPALAEDRDPLYQERLRAAVAVGEFSPAEVAALAPANPAAVAELRRLLHQGNRNQARLAALIGATLGDPGVQAQLVQRAWDSHDEATTLACLLAADPARPAQLPALAFLVQDPRRPLSVRAAAAGMVLELDCDGVWPWCRSLLRSGTAQDEDAPWADWPRDSRWELPKRLLVVAIDRWLAAHGEAASGFEPNAAWAVQLDQLKALEPRVESLRRRPRSLPPPDPASAAFQAQARLLRLARDGDRHARMALAWLMPLLRPTLQAALTSRDTGLAETARQVMAELPR